MSIRRISFYNDSNEYIQKSIDVKRKIPLITNFQDLEEHESEFDKREYLSIYQQLMELEVWNNSSEKMKSILAPLVRSYYDKNNALVLVFPRYEPLMTEDDAFRFEDEEVLPILQNLLSQKGMSDDEIGDFIEKMIDFCDEWDLSYEDIVNNLNNIGWHSVFKVSIIDYGLSNEMIDKFYTNEEDENVYSLL